MLDVLGLDNRETLAYRALVSLPSGSADDVAGALGCAVEESARLLSSLESKGLVARSSSTEGRYVASPPAVAIGALIVQRQDDLRRAQLELGSLTEMYRGAATRRTVADVVDVVLGPDAVRQRFAQLQMGARHEVMVFVKSGVVAVSAEENVEEDKALERGVKYRVVVEREVLERPGFFKAAEEAMEYGEEVRVTPTLPTRLVIVDRQLALLPILASPEDQSGGALLLHASGLLEMVIALFERTWHGASPLVTTKSGVEEVEGGRLGPLDAQILRLLHAGLTDHAVATQLQVSMRTVQRRVRVLMDTADVETRLQLGVEAARRGWL